MTSMTMCRVHLIVFGIIICDALAQLATIAPLTGAPPTPMQSSTMAPPTPWGTPTMAPPTPIPLPTVLPSMSTTTAPATPIGSTTASPSAAPNASTNAPTTSAPSTGNNAFYVLLMPNVTEAQFFAQLVAVLNTTTASVAVFARGTVNVSQTILFVDFPDAPLVVTLSFVNFTFTGSNAAALTTRCEGLDISTILIPIGVAYGLSYIADFPVPTRSPSTPLFSCRLLSITVDTFRSSIASLLSVTVDTVLIVSVGWETYDNNSTNGTAARHFAHLAVINATRVNFTFVGNLSSQAVASLLLASPATLASVGILDLKVVVPAATPVPAPLGKGNDPNSTPLLLIIGLSIGGAIVVIVLVALFCITSRKRRTGNSSELGGVRDRFGKSGAKELALVLPTLDADNSRSYSTSAANRSTEQPGFAGRSHTPHTNLDGDAALNFEDNSPLQHLDRGRAATAVNKNFEESGSRTEVRGMGFVAFGDSAPQHKRSKGVDDDDYMDLL